ncbi:AMP-binding protein [Allorhizobium sp. BGMRC 0089]|uniref:AMP-binding protein n=1 Tax=Allorhizobium sonneratiae TaxID=2934936 RepID=UPI00203425CB|nr:AMP-binding protein [Allorhizobium sonneratiae]MCM2292164.1 AMP-binding protein [Allorhizobium sonneratiae]
MSHDARGNESVAFFGLAAEDPIRYRARTGPDRPAVLEVETGLSLSYGAFDEMIARSANVLGSHLSAAGTLPRVCFIGRNSIAELAICFACQRIGAIFVPINWRLSAHEIQQIVEDCTPHILIDAGAFSEHVDKSAIVVTFALEGEEGFLRQLQDATPRAPHYGTPERITVMLYTSGTTGQPKGVMLSARSLFYAAMNFAFVCDVASDSTVLCDVPLFHTIGLVALARTTMLMGGRLVISDRFIPERSLAVLSDPALQITHYSAVPQMAATLKASPNWNPQALRALKAMFIGGAPLPPALIERFLEDGIALANGYGMSELGTAIHMPLDKQMIARYPGAIGYCAPFLDIRIVDAEGHDVEEGEVGEIWLKGPSLMSGYWNKPELSEAALSEGWYRTGDLGRREHGIVYLADRLKDMYISGGENVYPAEVEAALAVHDGIVEAAVLGVADPLWGEVGLAVIVRADPSLEESHIEDHCAALLAGYKRPKRIVFADSLPRTASGKVQKHVLRALYFKEKL